MSDKPSTKAGKINAAIFVAALTGLFASIGYKAIEETSPEAKQRRAEAAAIGTKACKDGFAKTSHADGVEVIEIEVTGENGQEYICEFNRQGRIIVSHRPVSLNDVEKDPQYVGEYAP